MITFVNFLWLIHYLLVGFYFFGIGQYVFSRLKHRSIHQGLSDLAPGAQAKYWEENGGTMFGFGLAHTVIFGIAMEGVPIYLICLLIIFAIADVKYETANGYIKAVQRREAGYGRDNPHNANQGDRSSNNFDFNEKAWKGSSTGDQNSSQGQSPPDYQSALRDALQEANKISDERAEKFAKVWEKLAAEPRLDPKVRLFRELVAMLLKERAKGFKGRADQSAPTEAEVAMLSSARPRQP